MLKHVPVLLQNFLLTSKKDLQLRRLNESKLSCIFLAPRKAVKILQESPDFGMFYLGSLV